jgi:hypothetical protein
MRIVWALAVGVELPLNAAAWLSRAGVKGMYGAASALALDQVQAIQTPIRHRVNGRAAVDLSHIGPAVEGVTDGVRVGVVDGQPAAESVLGIIRATIEVSPLAQAPDELLAGNLEPRNHRPRLESPQPPEQFSKAVGLGGGAWIPIEDEPLLGPEPPKAISYDAVDQLVGHQLPGRHDCPAPLPDHGIRRDLPPQDLARADAHQTETLREPLRLRPLARARRPEHDRLMGAKALHLKRS